MKKDTLNQQTPADAKPVLSAAASKWWDGLPVFKRELYIGRHYSDDTPTNDKIKDLHKMYKDWKTDAYDDFGSC